MIFAFAVFPSPISRGAPVPGSATSASSGIVTPTLAFMVTADGMTRFATQLPPWGAGNMAGSPSAAQMRRPAGSFVYGPRGIAHTFTVTSSEARFLLVTEPAGFEGFMRTLSEPALSLTVPPPATEPPDFERLAATAAEYGIEILGPPGIPS